LSVPASTTVSAGSASSLFSVHAGTIKQNQVASLIASLNGTSVQFSLNLGTTALGKHRH
jgi:hypothetical protein